MKQTKNEILQGRIKMLQGQLDAGTCLLGNYEKHMAYLKREIAKAKSQLG